MERYEVRLADGRTCCVRPARDDDARRVFELIGDMEGRRFAPGPALERWSAPRRDDRYACLVACADGEVIGVVNVRCEEQLHHVRPVAEIMELAVDGAWRGLGAGSGLFGAACRLARQRGCELIEVHSKTERARAHRFYRRQGMARTHVHLTLPLDRADAEMPAGGTAMAGADGEDGNHG